MTILDRARDLVADGWENIVTGLGTSRDKRLGAQVKPVLPVTNRAMLDDLYHGDDMAKKIASRAPADMVRKWISLTVDTGDEGVSGKESEIADDILQELNGLDAISVFREALTWARVFGGSLIYVGVDDGGGGIDSQAEPLAASVRAVEFLEVYDRFDVTVDSYYTDVAADGLSKYGTPKTYRIENYQKAGGATIPSVIVHESRMLRLDGPITSRRRRQRNNGWNDSVYTAMMSTLSDSAMAWGGIAHLLQDFAQGVFKMKGLGDAVAANETDLVLTRMRMMDLCRSLVRAIPVDADDEEFTRQVTPVSGLGELMDRMMLRMAAAADMPVTVLFGVSPAGLNSTAEGDLSIWYDWVESAQESDLRPPLTRLIDILLASVQGPTRGKEPDGWELTFNKLWQLDEKELAEARKIQADTDAIYIDTNVLEPDEVAASRFAGESYSFETILDKEAREADKKEPAEPEPPAAPVAPVPPEPPAAPEPPEIGA